MRKLPKIGDHVRVLSTGQVCEVLGAEGYTNWQPLGLCLRVRPIAETTRAARTGSVDSLDILVPLADVDRLH